MSELMLRLTAAVADRYTIEHELGRGGMATVFLAEHLKHHGPVAIKVLDLRDPDVQSAVSPGRFLREIETIANLSHPNILPVFDSGAGDDLLYYVMPYVVGGSLRERLARDKQLPLDDALRVASRLKSPSRRRSCRKYARSRFGRRVASRLNSPSRRRTSCA